MPDPSTSDARVSSAKTSDAPDDEAPWWRRWVVAALVLGGLGVAVYFAGDLSQTEAGHYGVWSILPPLIAIVLAFWLREVVSALFIGIAAGGGSPETYTSLTPSSSWESIFDDKPVSTFGDIAIAPSDTDVVWVGTGEQNNRQSTSWGNGVYRSTDGGETWKEVLYIGQYTGAVDLVMDPENPGTLYAATYQRLRRTWGFNGGGPGSGIHKTTDGGDSWTELTEGVPEGDKGRIGLATAKSNPDVLYATIEHAEKEGTFRSRDQPHRCRMGRV